MPLSSRQIIGHRLRPGMVVLLSLLLSSLLSPALASAVTIPPEGSSPALTATPSDGDFGDVEVEHEAERVVEIHNSGRADLTIEAVVLEGAPEGLDMADSCSQRVLAPRTDACRITLTFVPSAEGAFEAWVYVDSNDPDGQRGIPLTGRGVAVPRLNVVPEQIDFGDVVVGDEPRIDVEVRSVGTADLEVGDVLLDASPSVTLADDKCTDRVLAPTETCVATVGFAPRESGSVGGVVVVVSNDPAGAPEVRVTGRGIEPTVPVLRLEPSSLDLGQVSVGDTVDRDVTALNVGTAELSIGRIHLEDGGDVVTVARNRCSGRTLPVGGSCGVTVRFAPEEAGPTGTNLRVASNDPKTPHTIDVRGTAVPAPEGRLEVLPDPVEFGEVQIGEVGVVTVRATNVGDGTVTITDAAVTRTDDVALTVPSCSVAPVLDNESLAAVAPAAFVAMPRVVELAPGEFCDIELRYEPSSVATLDAVLVVSLTDPNGRQRVPLTGRGVVAPTEPRATVIPDPVDFAEVAIGSDATTSVAVTNAGGGVLAVRVPRVDGSSEVTIVANDCDGARLRANQSCTFGVVYAPVSVGALDGVTLVLSSSDPAGDRVVLARGTGAAAPVGRLALPDGPVDFGDVAVGEAVDRTVSAANDGDGELTIGDIAVDPEPVAVTDVRCPGHRRVLAPDKACEIDLRYEPTVEGSLDGALVVASSDPDGPDRVRLVGNAVPPPPPPPPPPVGPRLLVSDDTLDFGEVPFSASFERVIVVRNVGDAPAPIHGVDLRTERGGFVLTRDRCTRERLRPGASCEVSVRFSPTAAATFNAELSIAAVVDDPPSVLLRGTGTRVDDPEPEPPDDEPDDDGPGDPTEPAGPVDDGGDGREEQDTSPVDDAPTTTIRPDLSAVAAALALAALVGTLPLTVPDQRPRWVRRHLSVRLRPAAAPRVAIDDRGRQARTVRLAPRPGPGSQSIDEEAEPW
ncbi:MAG TPA: choice-of-anchor D domain-containing protein [Euzebyales bacterium]